MPSVNKEAVISEILIQLGLGNNYTPTYSLMFAKFRFSKKTFDKYWKLANGKHTANELQKQNELIEQSKQLAKETLKKAILSKDEILERLTEIGLGKAKKVEGQIIMPSYAEQINAMKTINDMQGYKAVIKTDVTTNGESINKPPIDLSKLSDSALEELQNLIPKKE